MNAATALGPTEEGGGGGGGRGTEGGGGPPAEARCPKPGEVSKRAMWASIAARRSSRVVISNLLATYGPAPGPRPRQRRDRRGSQARAIASLHREAIQPLGRQELRSSSLAQKVHDCYPA